MSRTRQRTIAALSAVAALPLLAGPIAPAAVTSAAGSSIDHGAAVAQANEATPAGGKAFTAGLAAAAPAVVVAEAATPAFAAAPTTHWVSPNSKFVVKAKIPGGKGSVMLQQKFGDDWVNIGKPVKISAKGDVTISAISEDFQRTTTYRVSGGSTFVSNEFTVELGAGKHTSVKLAKGNPRWKPCASATEKEPIVYQLNLAKVPAEWTTAKADIEAAIADISAVTGIKYQAHSTPNTTVFPKKGTQAFDTGVDMVIAAGDATDSNLLSPKVGKVLAWGGWTMSGSGFIDKGFVMIDNRQKLEGGDPVAGKSRWQVVLRHELAHAMGVTHPSDVKQIMNPTYNNLITTWGAGDLNALQLVGVRKPSTMVYGQTADDCHAVTG